MFFSLAKEPSTITLSVQREATHSCFFNFPPSLPSLVHSPSGDPLLARLLAGIKQPYNSAQDPNSSLTYKCSSLNHNIDRPQQQTVNVRRYSLKMQETGTEHKPIHIPPLALKSTASFEITPTSSLREERVNQEEDEEPAYLQILPSVNPQQLEGPPGNTSTILAEYKIEEDEKIYDNDDCFPPEFLTRMKAKYKSKASQDAHKHDPLLLPLLKPDGDLSSSTDCEDDDDSDLYTEVDQFQMSMRIQGLRLPHGRPRRISSLVEALDLPPSMRGRSSGLSQQQANNAKQRIRLSQKKNSPPAAPKEAKKGEKEVSEGVRSQPIVTQECGPDGLHNSLTPPNPQDQLSQQKKLETFEKLLEAHGTPRTGVRPTPTAASRRDQFKKSMSTPITASLPPIPTSVGAEKSRPQHYCPLASNRNRTVFVNATLPRKDKKYKAKTLKKVDEYIPSL